MNTLAAFALAALLAMVAPATAASVVVVAAENFYADVAQQIGGPGVRVTSVLNNPSQDPHLFEASPAVARELAAARIVIANGIGYDPWMERLLAAVRAPERKAIVVAPLIGKKPGDNPHVWYDPAAMLALARSLADELTGADPARRADYQQRLAAFEQSMEPIRAKIAALRSRVAGVQVTATEPIFGYMFDALGLQVRNQAFQLAVMNNTEPSASEMAAFETDLKSRRVRMLVYNSQASSPVAERMRALAKAAQIPVVGAAETQPAGESYQAWMLAALDAVDRALPE